MNWLIQATDLSHQFGAKRVLHNVSLRVAPNEIVTIIGPNGSGKSTLIKILIGLIRPTQGKVVQSPNCRIGYVPQQRKIPDTLPLRVVDYLGLTGASATEIQAIAEQTQCAHLLQQAMQHLSGGEYQRVALARALLNKPSLLVLDEPAQGMDLMAQQQLYSLLNQLKNTHRCAILMISHDLHLVMRGSQQVICLNQHICCQGQAEAIAKDPAYIELFGQNLDQLAVYHHHHTDACDHEHGEAFPAAKTGLKFHPVASHVCQSEDCPHTHHPKAGEKTDG